MDWKVGDWVIFDLGIGQIKKLDDQHAWFSDGTFETSGRLVDRFRPLTLRGKRFIESFDIYYNRLRDIDGESGFNYPDIHRHFCQLALDAIDGDDNKATKLFTQAEQFVCAARDYKGTIQGVRLFRPNMKRAAK